MRTFTVWLLLLLSFNVFSQDTGLPSRCGEMLKTPTPTNEALCTELYPLWISAQEQYVNALSKVEDAGQWHKLWAAKNTFMVGFYNCKIKGATPLVVECLRSAFQDFSSQLPAVDSMTDRLAVVRDRARKVNQRVADLTSDKLSLCVAERIKALDDGISPARDIATAIGTSCNREAAELARVFYAAQSIELITDVPGLRELREMGDKFVSPESLVIDVLRYRASVREKAQQKKKDIQPRSRVES